jgi:hypothetical protein
MRTYVAEINGEAVMAFRAEDDEKAQWAADEENGGLRLGLNGANGLYRVDGTPLCDLVSEIKVRRATETEHNQWVKARDSEIGSAHEGKQIDPSMNDDPDELNVYLVPTKSLDAEEAAAIFHEICAFLASKSGHSIDPKTLPEEVRSQIVREAEQAIEQYEDDETESLDPKLIELIDEYIVLAPNPLFRRLGMF